MGTAHRPGPRPWMPGPVESFTPQGPCRSCDFLRAGLKYMKPLRMWSGVQSALWALAGSSSSNYNPVWTFPGPSFTQLMVGVWSANEILDPDHGGGVLWTLTLSVRDMSSCPTPQTSGSPCLPLLLTLPTLFLLLLLSQFLSQTSPPTLPPPPAGLHPLHLPGRALKSLGLSSVSRQCLAGAWLQDLR